MTDKPLSIRLPEPLKVEEIDAVAQRRGMSRAGFVISAVKFFMELDDVFLARMENYAKRLNIPLPCNAKHADQKAGQGSGGV